MTMTQRFPKANATALPSYFQPQSLALTLSAIYEVNFLTTLPEVGSIGNGALGSDRSASYDQSSSGSKWWHVNREHHGVVRNVVAKLIGAAKSNSGLEPTAGDPHRESTRMMIPP